MKMPEKPLGIAWLSQAKDAYRRLTKQEQEDLHRKFENLLKKYAEKKVKFIGEYGPIVGTEWSRVVLLESPDFDTFVEFRREWISLLDEYYRFLPVLLGRLEPLQT